MRSITLIVPSLAGLSLTGASVEAFVSGFAAKTARPIHVGATKAAAPPATRDVSSYPDVPLDLVDCFPPSEWQQRCSLAVSYRIAYLHEWHENIFNHITLKVEGSDEEPDGPHFLLNDYGLGFDEITASNLLKVNLDGRIVSEHQGRVFKPGYVLHSAIHAARHDVTAIWHGHDLDTTAVSQTKFGVLPLSQEATFALKIGISYHPFEGSANDLSEQPRLVNNLGPTNQILMLEDHGPIVACPTIEESFAGMYFLTRACKYQIKSLSAVGGDLSKIHMPAEDALSEMKRRAEKFDKPPETERKTEDYNTPSMMFNYARRSAERTFGKDSIYR